MAYPSTVTTFTNPHPTNRLDSPSHSSIETAQNTGLTEIQTFVGTISSLPGTLMYDIRSANSNGGGHVQTANKGGTGQTAFTKGDLLVGQSSSVLSKLAVGATGNVLIADSGEQVGVKWGNATGVNVQSFIGSVGAVSSGFWGKPSNAGVGSRVFIQLWGGGGSGAGSNGTTDAGGGGGGAYVEGWLQSSVLSATELVVVGAGGAAVADGAGNAGGVTVFGTLSSLLSAFGGGTGASAGNAGGGGAGGAFTVGAAGSGANGGAAGAYGWTEASSIFSTGGGPSNARSQNAVYSSGGGGDGAPAGSVLYGGAGGGGARASVPAGGGISKLGGNGGHGRVDAHAAAGSIPGGGGGAVNWGATSYLSGAGGPGKAIITTYI